MMNASIITIRTKLVSGCAVMTCDNCQRRTSGNFRLIEIDPTEPTGYVNRFKTFTMCSLCSKSEYNVVSVLLRLFGAADAVHVKEDFGHLIKTIVTREELRAIRTSKRYEEVKRSRKARAHAIRQFHVRREET